MSFKSEDLIKIRRKLHQIPEIGLCEFKTQAFLLSVIKSFPQNKIEIATNETAIRVKVKGSDSKKTIGWRTDMDGLPIEEETHLTFASNHPGKMHACGHDFHMTIALGLLQRTIEDNCKNDRVFLFQPAEENESGAKIYADNGFFTQFKIDELYAMHVAPHLKSNVIGTIDGTLFAGECGFEVEFIGKGGHAAYPHETNDTIVAASAFVQQVQTIVSRNISPTDSVVISFGQFNAGTVNNIIPETATLTGSIRTINQHDNDLTQKRMKEIAKGIAYSFQCEVNLSLDQKGYVPVINDRKLTDEFIKYMKLKASIEFKEVAPMMAAEDFGYLLNRYPGTMFWYGVESEYGLHHSKFNPNEKTLITAVDEIHQFLNSRD